METEKFNEISKDFTPSQIEKGIKWIGGKKTEVKYVKAIHLTQRMNEVFGLNGWQFSAEIIENKKETRKTQSGEKPCWVVVLSIRVSLLENGDPISSRFGIGACDSYSGLGDALKGALTDGLKKTLAYYGAGWKTYTGLLDEEQHSIEPNDDKKSQIQTAMKPFIDVLGIDQIDIICKDLFKKPYNNLSLDQYRTLYKDIKNKVEKMESDPETGESQSQSQPAPAPAPDTQSRLTKDEINEKLGFYFGKDKAPVVKFWAKHKDLKEAEKTILAFDADPALAADYL